MAKKSVRHRNIKRIKLNKRLKAKRKDMKEKIYDTSLPIEERIEWHMKLQQLPRDSSRTRLRNRCRITGRPRGVYKKFGLSRIKVREFAMRGEIPGLVKSSW